MVFTCLSRCGVGAARAPGRVPALPRLPEGRLQKPLGCTRLLPTGTQRSLWLELLLREFVANLCRALGELGSGRAPQCSRLGCQHVPGCPGCPLLKGCSFVSQYSDKTKEAVRARLRGQHSLQQPWPSPPDWPLLSRQSRSSAIFFFHKPPRQMLSHPQSTTTNLGVSPQRSPVSPGGFGTPRAAFFLCKARQDGQRAAGREQHQLLQAPGLRPAHRYESPGAPSTARGNTSGCLHSLCVCAP